MKWSELFSRVTQDGSYKYKDIWFTARHLDHPGCVSLADVIKCEYNVGAIKELARLREYLSGAELKRFKGPPIDCRWSDEIIATCRQASLAASTLQARRQTTPPAQLQLPL